MEACWKEIPSHFPHVELDEFVVMPNHVHGILWITNTVLTSAGVGARHAVPLPERFGRPVRGSIPTVVRSFKSAAANRINEIRKAPGVKLWQRNYYEHIMRNEEEMNRILEYIIRNPAEWESDPENPSAGM